MRRKPANRYWAGKGEYHSSESSSEEEEQNKRSEQAKIAPAPQKQPTQKAEKSLINEPERDYASRRIVEEDTDDEEEEELRRQRIRQRQLQQTEEEVDQKPQQAVKYEQEEESSEYTSESSEEEEEVKPRILVKPVFVSKNKRETVIEKENREKRIAQELAEKEKRLQDRKLESSEMVMEELRKEMAQLQKPPDELHVDDTDGLDEDEEHAAWKVRELTRLMRDREAREKRKQELIDIERRRKMTDEQVEEENEKLGKNRTDKKGQYRFLQKYYHKGAFYHDDEKVEEALEKTDSAAPVLEDHFDKTYLPEILQVKDFGKRGRSKYTHLTDQDTTQFGLDATWSNPDFVSQNMLKKMGGMKSTFSKPALKKHKAE